jgi:hypothetical protein
MGIVKQKSNGKGSLKAIQQLINEYPEILNRQLLKKVPSLKDDSKNWLSPLSRNDYAEYSDDDFIKVLGLNPPFPLEKFWPKRGPQWDALGKSKNGDVFLIEAKANIPEIVSGPTGAGKVSKLLIDKALIETKIFLDIKNNVDWSGKFYQYTNRLAHLYFMRELNKIPAWLVNIYFLNDKSVNGPKTKEEWISAIRVMKKYLGIGRHNLSKYVIDLFIDVKELKL